MADLLVVEDDETIGAAVESGLRSHGHQVWWQRTARGALDAAGRRAFALVLLDLGLPDLDGVEVCRRLRLAQPSTVLVILTARQDEIDVVVGLEAGADASLTKPFRFAELLARVRAHLRRSAAPPPAGTTAFSIGDLVVDTAARRVTAPGTEGPRRRDGGATARQGVRPAGAPGRRRGARGQPRDPHGRCVGRELVRLNQAPRRARGGAAPQDHRCGPGAAGGPRDRHPARSRLPAGGPRGLDGGPRGATPP